MHIQGYTTRFAKMIIMALFGFAFAAAVSAPVSAAVLDPDNPDDALKIQRKMICGSLTDGRHQAYTWQGNVYSRVQGEKDRLVFKVVGTNVRQCTSVIDPEKGKGFRSVSREVMLYLDAESGEVLRRWTNPWTGNDVEVVHVANDPVNMRAPMFASGRDGNPLRAEGRVVGDLYLSTSEFPLFYPNPLGGDYQQYIGGTYQAIELFNHFVDAKGLFDADMVDAPRSFVSWVRVSQWLPWMEMDSRPGYLIFNTQGSSIDSPDEIPAVLKAELEANYPTYFTPPPVDDSRPNDTSWTVFKRLIDGRRKTDKE